MSVRPIHIDEFVGALQAGHHLVIDARSPGEYAAGHIPGAISLPLLNDEERAAVGTEYRQGGRERAVQTGFSLVGHKFADYAKSAKDMAAGRPVMVYCWRGGMRSGIMAWILDLIGLRVLQLEGGYKSWRHYCLARFSEERKLLLVSGMTGTGKTDLLHALRATGEQVLDLEALASHRGSTFGGLGLPGQPTQEQFENDLALALTGHPADQRLWIEDESRFIGKLRIPDSFFLHMQRAPEIEITRPVAVRATHILKEYGKFDRGDLRDRTEVLRKRMGGEQVQEALQHLESDELQAWAEKLLAYYDKTYLHTRDKRRKEHDTRVIFTADAGGTDAAALAVQLAARADQTNE
jgi:tRNA 2-selenouridine synthase